MAIYYRRVLDEPQYNLLKTKCDDDIDDCPLQNDKGSNSNSNSNSSSNLPFSPILLVAICFLVAIFFLICYLIVLKKYRLNLRDIRRSGSSNMNDQRDENIINQDHGPELIHPIWLINTIGLQQMVIDSIAIIKYKRGEGLVEETDCTICLSEFEDDESLRLLPKCSHAFHIACIDTWLRSHKNCPLCRAPIVVDTSNVGLSTVEATNGGELNASEDDFAENLDGNGDIQRRQDGEDSSGAMELTNEETNASENINKTLLSNHSVRRDCDVGVQKEEGGSQEVRRSVSLDSSSALMIRIAVANIDPLKVAKHGNNKSLSRIYGAMKSSSFRHFSEKRQVSMKRTFSSGRRKSRSSKSHESILPL